MENREFNYTYTAPTEEERKEIASIKRQYEEQEKPEETKLQRLRRLDAKVRTLPIVWSLTVGVVGILIFGLGLTTVLEWQSLWLGAAIMAVGAIPTVLAYSVYKCVLKRGKKKYGAEIVQLSEELLNQNQNG